jgi:DNA-binding response OmpR family regulator
MGQTIVILEKDPKVAQYLVWGLRPHFQSVDVMESHDNLREKVSVNQPGALILDIEHWRITDVECFHREFPQLPIVCMHRIPDEEMWMAALEAGATDVCPVDDVGSVLTSVLRSLSLSQRAAA